MKNKLLRILIPLLYLALVLFVIFDRAKYDIGTALKMPFILYVLMATVSYIVLRSVVNEETKHD